MLSPKKSEPMHYPDQERGLLRRILNDESASLVRFDIPFHRQLTDATCGPAVGIMIAKALLDLEFNEPEAMLRMDTNIDGTLDSGFINFLEEDCELKVKRRGKQNYQDLAKALDKGKLVVVEFEDPTDGDYHFALVRGVSDEGIALIDPYHGPDCALTWDDFIWCSGPKEHRIAYYIK